MPRGLVSTVLLSLALALVLPAVALAQDGSTPPAPATSPIFIDPLDPRGGEAASQVGAPFLALVAVLVLGIAAAGLTYAYVRLVHNR